MHGALLPRRVSHVPRQKVHQVASILEAIHAAEDVVAAKESDRQVVNKLREQRLMRAAKLVEGKIQESLGYHNFPKNIGGASRPAIHWSASCAKSGAVTWRVPLPFCPLASLQLNG